MADHNAKSKELRDSISAFSTAHGSKYCKDVETSGGLLIYWLGYLRHSEVTGVANELLSGVHSAILEVAACLSTGLMRPALFSIRAQIDMALSWLYFKDHKIEWRLVCDVGEGFKLKTELIKYLDANYSGYGERFGILKQVKTRTEDDPYRILSAHVHSQSVSAIPAVFDLKSLVSSTALCNDCVKLQFECSEYMNDILLSCFASKWASLPSQIMDAARARLSGPQAKILFR